MTNAIDPTKGAVSRLAVVPALVHPNNRIGVELWKGVQRQTMLVSIGPTLVLIELGFILAHAINVCTLIHGVNAFSPP